MKAAERLRLRRTRMSALGLSPALGTAAAPAPALEVVRRVGALQAQDYHSGMWSLGVRSGLTLAEIEGAVVRREIVRTSPMRGTIHLVPAEDARWMCRLLGVPSGASLRSRHAELGISPNDVELAGRIFEEHLAEPMSRSDVAALLVAHRIDPAGQRAYHLIGYHCMSGLLCQGPLIGRQPSFVLLDAWTPASAEPSREQALLTLAERYVRGHGPVTEKDLAGWINRPLAFTREALTLAGDRLVREEVDGHVWLTHIDAVGGEGHAGVQLLPQWDEFLLGYKSRDVTLPPRHFRSVVPGRNMVFTPTLVVDGQVAGTWRRVARSRRTLVEVTPFSKVSARTWRGVQRSAAAYGRFLGADVEVRLSGEC